MSASSTQRPERLRVLRIIGELVSFDLDAELDDAGRPRALFWTTGGPSEFDEMLGEEPQPVVERGPCTWSEVREKGLFGTGWLRLYPRLVHASIADLIRSELPAAPDDARARWQANL